MRKGYCCCFTPSRALNVHRWPIIQIFMKVDGTDLQEWNPQEFWVPDHFETESEILTSTWSESQCEFFRCSRRAKLLGYCWGVSYCDGTRHLIALLQELTLTVLIQSEVRVHERLNTVVHLTFQEEKAKLSTNEVVLHIPIAWKWRYEACTKRRKETITSVLWINVLL